ncbi:MAG: hypothetical protein E7631_04555 [Ruminococcaceae bacterium]|nr:hypothetical protein [Oscillospiraceae bacterium]
MFEEISVIRKICGHINAWEGAPCLFLPESAEGGLPGMPAGKALPAGTVTALSGPVKVRSYVDGSFIGEIPFAVFLRTAHTPADGLEALEWFAALTRYLGTFAPSPDTCRVYGCCEPTALPAKSSVEPDGTEEYRAAFTVRYRQKTDG